MENKSVIRETSDDLKKKDIPAGLERDYQVEDLVKNNILKKDAEIEKYKTPAEQSQLNESRFECQICLDDENEHQIAFVPCGHLCCTVCAPHISECHVCRNQIDSKVRLYT